MQTVVEDFFNQICCPVSEEFNLDVDSNDWAGAGITDQNSFNSAFGVNTSAFLLSGNNIKATITGYSLPVNQLFAGNKNITNVNFFTVVGTAVIDLSGNLLTDFNPSVPLPTIISQILLNDNSLTTSSYASMETWANGLHIAPDGYGTIDFRENIDSVSGTQLETILVGKSWTVIE